MSKDDKEVIKQADGFMFFADGSKESIDEYRKRHSKLPRKDQKEKEYSDYNKKNKAWIDAKKSGENV